MKKHCIILSLFLLLLSNTSPVFAQEENPWGEVFDENGNLRSDLIDLGETTEQVDWMSIDLPFGQSLTLDATYHRYETASGNVVVMPSASTLFFMAMSPQESGLADSFGMNSNGYGSMINTLGLMVGDHLNWDKVLADHPEYSSPDQFWGDVVTGKQDIWTYFSGWSFITNLLNKSFEDSNFYTTYLLFLKESQECAALPGGCAGLVNPLPTQTQRCADPQVEINQPTITIQKTAPNYVLVIGQDTQNRRGADVQTSITIPPVIFTWHEAIYEDHEVCDPPLLVGELPICRTETVFKGCRTHVEHLPDAVASLQATAILDGASQAWITGKLGQTHYGAYVHQANFSLIPGLGNWWGGCDGNGTCTATGQALGIPFADPGTFNLQLNGMTTGTQFRGVPITQPRVLRANGTLQVYVTLPALVQ
ncbi:MAG: hypothetical protein JEZ00_11495 [Anaerolineaceae bacterium]|nr:hypothetical protein [Anaerolineaceae bacterium]